MLDKRTASFMRALALGQIEEEILLPFPEPRRVERATLAAVLGEVRGLLEPRAAEFAAWDRAGALPGEVLAGLRERRLFGLAVPEHHGGLGLSASAYARVLQELARFDASVAITVGAHGSLGVRGLLLFGTEEQKARYLPRLASGELLGAFCLTEPGAGSDAAAIAATAVRDAEGYRLSGEKIWIANGGVASLFTVFARTAAEGAGSRRGRLTAFLVPRDLPGVRVGAPDDKLGIRACSTAAVTFTDVRLGPADVLGAEGHGFKVAMRTLNAGRTGLGGGAVGGMKRLISLALEHARTRRQFGRPLAGFGLVRQALARMVVDCYAAESVVTLVAGLTDRGFEDTAVEAAVAKVLATENLWRTADAALQLAGGAGYLRDRPYEQALRDARINRIFEGTSEVLRLFIALTTVGDAAAALAHVQDSVRDVLAAPLRKLGVLSDYARRRAALHVPRLAGTGQERGRWRQLHPAVAAPAAQFEESARALALAVDRALRRHGGKLVDAQPSLRRLADALIELFAFAAVLARVSCRIEDLGERATAAERDLLRAVAGGARRRAHAHLAALDENEDEALEAVAERVIEGGWDGL